MKHRSTAIILSMLFLAMFGITKVIAASEQHSKGHDSHASHKAMPQEQSAGHADHPHGMHGDDENEWISPKEEMERPNPIPASAESIETGSRLFKHFCITCHGYKADGKGLSGQNLNPKPANLTRMAGHHTDGDLAYKIKTGRGPMPHWEMNISDTNVWHIVNYIQNLKPLMQDDESSSNPHDHSQHKH